MVEVRRPRFGDSLTTNAVALMTATLATNAFGLVFWAVAARLKQPHEVGRAAAVVAGATLLSTVAQLNLTNVFIRLVPASGRWGKQLVAKGYATVLVFSVVLGIGFQLTGLSGHLISGDFVAKAAFVVTVSTLAIFALQDSVLTSLRLATWVGIENVSFSIAKLALLPLGVLLLGGSGIIVTWVVPAAVAVVVVSGLLALRVFPSRASIDGQLPSRGRILNFIAAEYVGNICGTASTQMMPLIIDSRLGASATAYFTLPWMIAAGVMFLMWNVASSFVVELAGGHGDAEALARRSGLLLAGIVAVALVVCVVGAHPFLEILGSRYAKHGTALLRLVGLSMPFYAVVAIYTTLAWIDRKVWLLAGMVAASGAIMVLATLALISRLGLDAAGWAFLGTQALLAAATGPLAVARLRRRLVESA